MESQQAAEQEDQGRWRSRFLCLFATQFQGAFSDNFYKFLVLFFIIDDREDQRLEWMLLTGAGFALPFVLFSMSSGMLADRVSKYRIAVGTKIAEVAIMSVALVAMINDLLGLMVAVMFLMCLQSAFFGPAKYGLIPELVPRARITLANGILSLGTFLAIILGVVVAGELSEAFGHGSWQCGVSLVLLALAGFGASLGIGRVRAADPSVQVRWNPLPILRRMAREYFGDRLLALAILGSSYFWFLGATMQFVVLIFGKDVLELDSDRAARLQGAMAVGIAVGSLAAGFVSRRGIEYRLIPLGAMGLAACLLLLALLEPAFGPTLFLLMGLGCSGGLYVVPQMAILQTRPAPERKGSILGFNAVVAFSGVFLASVAYYLCCSALGMSDTQLMGLLGASALPVALIFWLRIPRAR